VKSSINTVVELIVAGEVQYRKRKKRRRKSAARGSGRSRRRKAGRGRSNGLHSVGAFSWCD